MAQVTEAVHQRIEFLLEDLTSAWRELPTVEREIDAWDLIEQVDYIEEWTPKEELRHQLDRLAEGEALNDEQVGRYRELLQLVAKHRPILDRLRSS